MAARGRLLSAPPHAVEKAITTLGNNLRTARLRRNLTLEEIAEKIGVSRQLVSEAERGKPSSSIGLYVALLWALGLVDQLEEVADPTKDAEGMALSLAHERTNARRQEALDNDF
jgi:transcriptional regulator with XRE-family HTH domain